MGFNLRHSHDGSVEVVNDRLGSVALKLNADGSLQMPAAVGPRVFDDFLGDVIGAEWAVAKGSDAAAVDFAHLTGVNGLLAATTGAGAGADMAANGVQLHQALQWKANQGGLVFEARVKIAAITTCCLFVGLTDQIAALEMPINSAASADTLTSNASDAVGFMFDTAMATDNIWAVGVKADTDATHQNLAQAPVADTFITLRVEVDSSGNADFFINGARVGSKMAAAVTATVALTPVIAFFRRAATATLVTVDYVLVQATRV